MGTTFRVVLYAATEREARTATLAAFARIDELDRILSDYDAGSEISHLANSAGGGTWVAVGPDLWTVLRYSNQLAGETGGAFDVTVGPLTRLWRWSSRRGVLPDPERVDRARAAVGHHLIQYDSAGRRVRLTASGMRLDLGAIGKGFAADEALRELRRFGIHIALIDAGGDIVAGAAPPGSRGWRIETSTVKAGVRVAQTSWLELGAMATSGDTYRSVVVGGIRYSHIVDPRTGLGVTVPRVVTVVAPTGAEADAFASALSVVGPAAAAAMLQGRADVSARILERRGALWREWVVGCEGHAPGRARAAGLHDNFIVSCRSKR